MPIHNLKDLLLHELRDLYDAEHRISEAIPKFAGHANSDELRNVFDAHLATTRGKIGRLERVFEKLGEKPQRERCQGTVGLLAEADDAIGEAADPTVRDAELISHTQRVEHYEIAAYGSVRTYANLLNLSEVVELLQRSLDEAVDADKRLTQVALQLNAEAVGA